MNDNSNPWTQENEPQPSQPKPPPKAPPTQWNEQSFRERFGQPGTPQELEAMEGQLGESGIKVSRNAAGVAGKVILPTGEYVDVINSAGLGGRGFQWLTGEGGGGGSERGSFSWGGTTPDPRRDQLYNLMMGRATQSLNIDPKDPIIAGQVNAFGAQQQRGLRNYLASQAEKQGPLANLGMEERMGAEKAAQATGSLQAQVMQNELGARRQEIAQALSQMGGLLSDSERLSLQRELAYLSNDQFLRELGLKAQQQAWTQNAHQSGLF